jgi:AbrB family looped-hinge helix DNA binding protein
VRITTKGQVTIPVEIRERLGLLPNTEVDFKLEGAVVRVRKAKGSGGRGRRLIARMRGRGDIALSTEEIMALTRGSRVRGA